ncbi:MAG: hypothetical protein ACPIOQ_71815 [Promethearchaeia archaeon]
MHDGSVGSGGGGAAQGRVQPRGDSAPSQVSRAMCAVRRAVGRAFGLCVAARACSAAAERRL